MDRGQKIKARLGSGFQVVTTLDKDDPAKGHGPWALVFDEPPESGGGGIAPSPVIAAMAALAACTAVTVGGVARRRGMRFQSLSVEIEARPAFASKADAEEAAAEGRSVSRQRALKRIVIEGDLSDAERSTLLRAAKFCPVNRMMASGLYEFEEELVCV